MASLEWLFGLPDDGLGGGVAFVKRHAGRGALGGLAFLKAMTLVVGVKLCGGRGWWIGRVGPGGVCCCYLAGAYIYGLKS